MSSIDLSLGLRLGLGRQALPSFDRFVSPGAVGGGDGSYANPWLPSEFTAAASGLAAGSRIGIKGGTDTAGLISPRLYKTGGASNFYFGAYGGGNKPMLRCDAPITGDWTDMGGNVWRHAVTYASASSSHSGNVYRDGLPMILVQNTAGLVSSGQAHNPDWGWAGTGIVSTTSGFVYIYSTVQPNGDGDGHAYSYSKYENGIDVVGDDVTIEDIEFRGSLHQGGNFHVAGQRAVIRRLVASHGSRHTGYLGPNFLAEDISFFGGRNRQENAAADHLVCNTTTFGGSDTGIMRRCTFDGARDELSAAGMALDTSADNVGGFYAHDNTTGKPSNVLFEACTFRDGANGFLGGALAVQITDAVLANAKKLIGEQNGNCTYDVLRAAGTVGTILDTNGSGGTQNLNTTDSVITLDGSLTNIGAKWIARSQNSGLTFNHTRLRDHITHASPSGTRGGDSIRKGTVKTNNCLFDGSFSGSMDEIAGFAAGTDGVIDPASDNNTYKTGLNWRLNNSGLLNFTAWKAAVTPADANSVAV